MSSGGVSGNERLTGSVALLLLVLLPLEAATAIALGTFLPIHIALGLALVPPLALKVSVTGWRMVRYYTRKDDYVLKGPPSRALRALAPLLVLSTISLFGSGVALVVTGTRGGLLTTVHQLSFVIFSAAVVVHIGAYALRGIRAGTRDWRGRDRLAGAGARRFALFAGVALGIVLAVALYSGQA